MTSRQKTRSYRYPPNVVLGSTFSPFTFTQIAIIITIGAALIDFTLTGFPETVIPYNYPFFGDVFLLLFVSGLLRFTHRILWNIVEELTTIVEYNRNDPLALGSETGPADIYTELSNALFLAYHPGVLLMGAVVGGGFVFGVMYALRVLSAYPYPFLNFGFGAAHGVFFGPLLGGVYLMYRSYSKYIIDINLLDPDGVGGYRKIGNGIVKLASYGVLFVTLDFIILSSVAFTKFTRFQLVVSALYFLLLCGFTAGTFVTTFAIRRRLIEIRDEKVAQMQNMFNRDENIFWQKYRRQQHTMIEAVNIIAIYAMFHQINRMNMWPMNLYSITRLGGSIILSITVFLIKNLGLVPPPPP